MSFESVDSGNKAMPGPPPLVRNQSSKTTRFCIAPIDTALALNSASSSPTHANAIDTKSRCSSAVSAARDPGYTYSRTGVTSAMVTPLTPCMKQTGYAPATLELAAVTPLPSLPDNDKFGRVDYFGGIAGKAVGDDDSARMSGLSVEVEGMGGAGDQLSDLKLNEPVDVGQQQNAQKQGKAKLIDPIPFEQGANPLHSPLASHLAMLHPNTPKEVIHFIATRMLTTEYPLGYTSTPLYVPSSSDSKLAEEAAVDTPGLQTPGLSPKEEAEQKGWTWHPIWTSEEDVQRAGVALDASKETREMCQDEQGKEADERLEWMYGVARRGWDLVNARMEGRGA